jgi:hypothetical protein
VNSENLNGHATPSVGSDEVKVDMESPQTPLEEKTKGSENAEDKAGILECFEHVCLQAGQS